MTLIQSVFAREIIDSRGNPTVEVEVTTNDGCFRSAVPSGASTGIYEACELRDDDRSRYNGKGVQTAIANIHQIISPALIGMDVREQEKIDEKMNILDGTQNKGKLGANAILGVSMSVCRAAACAMDVPLFSYIASLAKSNAVRCPVPCFNVINGGKHAANNIPFQEFMIAPYKAESFAEALRMGCEVYHTLKGLLKQRCGPDSTNVGDEGGFAPSIASSKDVLDLLMEAIRKAGYEGKIGICMDCAASEFYDSESGKYNMTFKVDGPAELLSRDELVALYTEWAMNYPILSIEDPFDQDDWEGWMKLVQCLSEKSLKTQVVGDDLTVTNVDRIEQAITKRAATALLLKINQIGTITESIQAWRRCVESGWNVMVSHRSGETEDTFIADLVVGLGTGQIKTGAPCRGERTAKLNQILRIEEKIEKTEASYGCSTWNV
ncbi:enolase [Perkinsela sp. CCAP 1560/4]|nr:enolase [Perkinsela sp. CCAP 1560/4]KNH06658.1 enolase [Perkinsela sp. CCAP 1560/4]|eukprot:KNH04653.1 enolase [Perkinsela sp. CCAP 1560/4]